MHTGSTPDYTGLSAEAQAELDALFAAEGMETVSGNTITPRAAGVPTPASFSQELLWMLDRAAPGLTAYNLPLVRRLRGRLDVPALERALSAVAARHEALRTRFSDGESHPLQIVDPPSPVNIRRFGLSSTSAGDREREAQRLVSEQSRTPIDLANEPSFRVTLVELSDDDHVLLIETHHIVVDGWSMGIIFRDLATAYAAESEGRTAELPVPALQFGDVAAWERKRLAGQRLDELLTFWRTQLGTASSEPLALPTDFPRSATPTFEGAQQTVIIEPSELAEIKQLGQAHDATLYMTLLAAYATVLHRYTGRSNVLIGSGSAGRLLPETEGIVGYLNNTLVQRADFSGNPTFAGVLARVRASAIDAYDHQDVPLEKLVLELREGQERFSPAPLFEVVMTMQDTIGGSLSLKDVIMESFGISFGATKFDVTMLVTERDSRLALTAQYRSDLFRAETMRHLLGHMVQILKSAREHPSLAIADIPLLTSEEKAELAAWNNTTVAEGNPATLVQLFQEQAARVPTRVAVVGGDATLDYESLNARSNQLARHLQRQGVVTGAPVALLLDRSASAITGLLGILKAGAAYVPLSVDAPASRLSQQIAECGAAVVVTDSVQSGKLPAGITAVALDDVSQRAQIDAHLTSNLEVLAKPSDLAYVLFTSGSTGVPKGVAVTHANVVHYARAVSRVLADTARETDGDGLSKLGEWTFGMASTLAADLGNTSLFPALLSGGTLHVLAGTVTTDAARFAEYLAQHSLDVLKITPNHLVALTVGRNGTELVAALPKQWIVLGGEALQPDVARRLLSANSCRVLNHYGPTETTVGVCTFEVTRESLDRVIALGAQTVPVGAPLANTHAYVVDANGRDLPVSIPGELWLGGAGVTDGYYKRENLTEERFVMYRGASGSERVYRTGDRVRRLATGHIEFLSRVDDQVKVRGYRVELGEIEQVLRAQPGVESAVVVLRSESADAAPTLTAYVVLKQSGYEVSHSARPSNESLKAAVGAQLPDYMIPASIVMLDALPLTANGKVNKAALPAPEQAGEAAKACVAPSTPTEEQIVRMWMDVFKNESIGVTDNFLQLGGHSLLAIRVLGKISKAFRVRLSLRALFDAPTVRELAELVDIEVELAAIDALSGNK